MDLIERKQELENSLIELKNDLNSDDKALDIQRKASNLFTDLEEKLCDVAGRKEDLSKTELEDWLSTIENIFEFVIAYSTFVKIWNNQKNSNYRYSPQTLSTAESVLNNYRKRKAMYYKKKFEENNFPIGGFEKKLPLRNVTRDVACVVIGVVLLTGCGLMAYVLDVQSSYQYLFYRVMISISIPLILSGLIKGVVEVKFDTKIKFTRIQITAVGSIALFIILYFLNPAPPPEINPIVNQVTKIEITD